ncbi:hypothetical protein OPV22_011328 [Ensete ventricosum]|uniref:G protein gamma domain-containing protein n=1 Tax=Ensete ventricosum TaxID=4639 RepID=A0AAV8RD80_ENSVE|nr:hypothetical protein OPV22_011328 [Ensete ventricosum]
MGETVPTAPPLLAPPVVVVAPSPKSPPKYPDLCGRRRLQLELQILNREVGFIEEELQSLEGIQPVSRCCKEVNDFVGTKPDPLIPVSKRRHRSCCLWRWIRSKLCFNFSWICCFTVAENAAAARRLLAVVKEHASAARKFHALAAEHAAAAQRFLAVAGEHAAAAQKILAVAAKHAAAAQKILAVAVEHAAAAQKFLALVAEHAAAAPILVLEHAAAAQKILAVAAKPAAVAQMYLAANRNATA